MFATLPTEPVGSLPRPQRLQEAYAEYDSGQIDRATLTIYQDAACLDAIEGMEATGSPIITDGEQRTGEFASYPFAGDRGAPELAANFLEPAKQRSALFNDPYFERLPLLTSGPFKYLHYASENLQRSIKYAGRPLKQAVVSPSRLSLLYPRDGEIPGYSRQRFHEDLCDECERDIRQCFAVGASKVTIDFREGRLLYSPRLASAEAGRLLDRFLELNNRVLDRFTAEERLRIGIHSCPGHDDTAFDYAGFLPRLFELNAGYFLIRVAGEHDRDQVYSLCGQHSRDDANGVAQICYVGVTQPRNTHVESPEEVCDALVRAADFIPKERLGSTDDCGFALQDRRAAPPDWLQARRTAFRKIAARVLGTQMASERLGI